MNIIHIFIITLSFFINLKNNIFLNADWGLDPIPLSINIDYIILDNIIINNFIIKKNYFTKK